MILLPIGICILLFGLWLGSFNKLDKALNEHDIDEWNKLNKTMSPFVVFMNKIALYEWVKLKRFESSQSSEVQSLGKQAFLRTRYTSWLIKAGLLISIVGFTLSLT